MASRVGFGKTNGSLSSNLVFSYDTRDFFNSYMGEPTTNTIPNPTINALPTFGNGWSTYNTNQYCGSNGCGNFWPIPAIDSISNNIVRTVSDHPMRSFDVLRPQTTGGGLTANVDYIIKKIDNTNFSLHAYNSSQDGSQGYINPSTGGFKVHDDWWNDIRIPVNTTNFPTMWWGAPHLPNSGLVKEIIVGGFDLYPSRKTDCIRLHAFRPDGVADGMAYGVDATVTPGQVHTYSFWTRAVNPAAANAGTGMSNYNYGSTSPTSWGHSWTNGNIGVWQRTSFNFTPINEYIISYFWPGGGQTVDIANIQVERKNNRTYFVAGSRSVTQSLKDTTNNITLDLTDMSFDVNSLPVFDGTNDKMHGLWPGQHNVDDNTTPRTWEIVVKKTGGNSDTGLFGHKAGPGCSYYCNGGIYQANGRWYFNWYDNSAYRFMDSGINATLNEYFHIVGVFDTDANPRIYVNGVLRASYGSSTQLDYSSGMAYYDIGFNSDGGGLYYFTGEIPVAKFYKNKALTDVEVHQNFLNYQQRFNMTFSQNGIGGNSSSSYVTSLDILKKTRTNTNGTYWFKPPGVATPFQAYVEFESNGGNPWMHVGTIADENDPSNNSTYHVWSNNMNSAQACPPWDDDSTFGGSTPTFVGDYKNAGWGSIPFKQIMIKDDGNSQRKILHTNEGQIKSSNTTLRDWFGSLKWDALGSDSSSSAYSNNRVRALDITNYGVNDPVLQSSAKSKLLFKYGEKDGAQDGNKDRTMIAWHRHDVGNGVDGPSGLGCFTNRGGTIDYRDIVPGSVYADGQDFPPSSIGGSYYYSIWIR